jgi:hypothetical protein
VIEDGGSAADSEDAHEHCSALSLRRPAEPMFELAATVVPPLDAAGTSPATRTATAARALYRLAPKVSPPPAA